jgi:hypothetical protein
MARLTFDALLILANLPAGEEHSLIRIAYDIFSGYDPRAPGKPTLVSMTRAQRAALSLATMKRATVHPSRKNIETVRLFDPSNGAIQAQFLMNLMVRGGPERRQTDRRQQDEPHVGERREGPRRTEAEVHQRPKRITRPVVRPAPQPEKPTSAFWPCMGQRTSSLFDKEDKS